MAIISATSLKITKNEIRNAFAKRKIAIKELLSKWK
jgi:hypothetical protein